MLRLYPNELEIGGWGWNETVLVVEGTKEHENHREQPWCQGRGLWCTCVGLNGRSLRETMCVPAQATQQRQVFLKVTCVKMQLFEKNGSVRMQNFAVAGGDGCCVVLSGSGILRCGACCAVEWALAREMCVSCRRCLQE